MKVQIFKELVHRFENATDGEKVFAGLLTFLYNAYPGETQFAILKPDMRTIFNLAPMGDFKTNEKLFRVGKLSETNRCYSFRQEITNREEYGWVELNELWSCTVQGYLLGLYKTRKDWTDYNTKRTRDLGTWAMRKDGTFSNEERDNYFKTDDTKLDSKIYGHRRKPI